MIPLLHDPEGQVPYAAASALGQIGPAAEVAIPELVRAFRNESSGGSSFAEALAQISENGILVLVQLLKDPDSGVQSGAAYALGRYALGRTDQNVEPSAVAALAEALRDQNDQVCSSAASALGWIGQDAVRPLAMLLQDQNRDVQLGAARSLLYISYTIGRDAKAAIPALIDVLQGQDIELASYAAEALGQIGPDASEAIPALVAALSRQEEDRDTDEFAFRFRESMQNVATFALGRMGKGAVPDLITLLSNSDKATRVRALLALSQIGLDAQEAVPHLIPLLQSEDEKIQLLAAIALAEMGVEADAVLPKLIAALQTENHEVRAKVISAIGNLGSSATQAVPDLIRTIGEGSFYSEDWAVRNSATQALIKIGANAVPFLVLALGHENTIISARSSFALTEIGSDAIPALVLALRDPNIEVRRRAAFVLGQIGSDTIPVLQITLQDEDTNARKGAIYALGIINHPSANLVSSLENIVENESNSLDERRVAASTLEVIGQDTSWFFSRNNLISPQNAACPIPIGTKEAEFDIYTGNCLMVYSEFHYHAGGGSLISALCNFFGC